MKFIIKRDGRRVAFDRSKIEEAILKSFFDVDGDISEFAETKAKNIADYIESQAETEELTVENIQDLVENGLMSTKRKDVARKYIKYRDWRSKLRGSLTDVEIEQLLQGKNEQCNKENSNKNPILVPTQRDYIAGIVSTDITERILLTPDIVEAHELGIIHFHDADYFAQNALTNCELVNLEDMLQNGTVINDVLIEKPHRITTASTISTQIILAVTSSTYGGCTITLTHLAPFVRASRYEIEKQIRDEIGFIGVSEQLIQEIVEKRLKKEVRDAVQTFNYQVNSMTNTNGQAPFLSVCMYLGETEEYKEELAMLIEEFLKQRLQGFKNKQGVWVTPAFPKLLYFLEEDNIHPDSKYYYLTELAAKCSAKRLTPDYMSEKIMKQLKINKFGVGDAYPVMGCRSALTPDRIQGNPAHALNYDETKGKYYGRFNQGVVTINLADVGLSAKQISGTTGQDIYEVFWKIFEERTELCHKALQIRHKRLCNITSDVAPILWQHGALARLQPGESIKPLLYGGYSTLSLGYAALYECCLAVVGETHTSGKGKEFGLQVMQALNDKCKQWKEAENIDYSLYGTPIESTTYKFAKCLRKRFGVIEGITDRDYVTNSYHIFVGEKIDAFSKIAIESEFQALSPGGAISYVEVPDMQKNIPAMLEIIKFIYDNIIYAEINSKSDYCEKCGYDGEIEIKGEPGSLYWQCPCCGNTDEKTMHVARRTCGYIGSNWWNQGRTQEIRDRVLHID